MTIEIKDNEAIEKMRIVGDLAARQLEMIEEHIKPGISTGELDRICHAYTINEQDAIPAPLNYRGFPKSICTSVNHVVCHGIPSDDKVLKSGDIINVDVTLIKDGYHGDTSKTFIVGTGGVLAERLTKVCQESLYLGIRAVKPGAHLGDIGAAIQPYVEKNRFSIVREYCGHGIGTVFHDDPQVLHYGKKGTGPDTKTWYDVYDRTHAQRRQGCGKIITGPMDGRHERPQADSPVGTYHRRHGDRIRNSDPA